MNCPVLVGSLPGADGSTTSRPNAAPLSTPASRPIISASPLPLWPPIGSSTPSPTFFGSVIGSPVLLCTTQPSCSGLPRGEMLADVAERRDRGGDVEHHRRFLAGRNADRDRIGADHRFGAAPRRHVIDRRHRGVDADHALRDAHLRHRCRRRRHGWSCARRPSRCRSARASSIARLVGIGHHQMADAVVAVDQRGRRRALQHLDVGLGIDPAGLDPASQ